MGPSVVILLVLATLSWLMASVCLFSVVGRQVSGDAAMGQGIGWLMTMILTGLTWLWIGGLLLKAGTQDLLPGGQSITAIALYLSACAATIAAIYLMVDTTEVWPAVCAVGLPPIVIGYIVALFQPGLRPAVQSGGIALAISGVMLLLILLPFPLAIQKYRAEQAAHDALLQARNEYFSSETERTRQSYLAKLQAMPPDADIGQWLELLSPASGVSKEAVEAFKRIDRRQADVEEMMRYGVNMSMSLLPEADIQMTPQLCQASHTYFELRAKGFKRRKINDPMPYSRKDNDLDESLSGIRWLQAHGCNCNDGIALLIAATKTYLDSPDRQQLIASLEALQQN